MSSGPSLVSLACHEDQHAGCDSTLRPMVPGRCGCLCHKGKIDPQRDAENVFRAVGGEEFFAKWRSILRDGLTGLPSGFYRDLLRGWAVGLHQAAVKARLDENEQCARLADAAHGAGAYTAPQIVIAKSIRDRWKEGRPA